MSTCVICGAFVQPHQADVTEAGLRCRACSMRDEIGAHERRAAEEEAARAQRRLTRRASMVASGHFVVWGGSALVFLVDEHQGGQRSWALPLLGLAFAVAVGLKLRWHPALVAALTIDALVVAAALGVALFYRSAAALVGGAILAPFPLLLGALLWSLRGAFRSSRS